MSLERDHSPLDGETFTKNELKSRLNQMDIEFDNYVQKKNYFVDLYNKAVQNSANRTKIQDKLNKDEQDRLDKKRKRRGVSEDAAVDLKISPKQAKLEKVKVESKPISNLNFKRVDTEVQVRMEEVKNAEVIYYETTVKENLISSEEDISNINEISKKEVVPKHPVIKAESPRKFGITTTKICLNKPTKSAFTETTTTSFRQATTAANNLATSNETIPEEKVSLNVTPQIPIATKIPATAQFPTTTQIPTFNFRPLLYNPSPNNKYFPTILPTNNPPPTQNANIFTYSEKLSSPSILNNEQILTNQNNLQNRPSPIETVGVSSGTQNNILQPQQRSNINSTTHLIYPRTPHQSNLPKTTGSDFQKIQNEVFTREFESMKKLVSVPSSTKEVIKVKEQAKVNGGELHDLSKITVPNVKTIPVIIHQNINGMDKWENPDKPIISVKLLVKYFLAGVVCSVMFYGLLYCIQNCPSITFESLGFNHKVSKFLQEDNIPEPINKGFEYFQQPGSMPKIEIPNFAEKIKEFFSPLGKVYWAITNPREFIWEYIIKSLGYMAFEIAWGYFKRNIWYFLGILTLKLIIYKAYKAYVNKSNAEKIFRDVKQRLRSMYENNKHLEGVTEEEIVREYAKDYKLKEDYFRSVIMPKLKHMRQDDEEIREFEAYVNGRNRIAWQYVGN